ncbi:MAG: tRNA (adenosine(37)-N6)-dimethylallyltransferase MiaA [Bacteroidota bacterium]
MRKLIVVQGPTASGKTDLAIELALNYNTEIISADSRQFYNELSIGTAKPNEQELAKVKHHFIDSFSIQEEISAAEFAKIAELILNKLLDKNNYVVLVGGSGMFVDALTDGLDDIPVNRTIREELTATFNEFGLQPLRDELAKLDPTFFEGVDQNNPMRIIRALEAIRASGQKMSDFLLNKERKRDFEVIRFSIDWPRDVLYDRINQRVDNMISQGLINEVKGLYEFRQLNALNTVGYKEIFQFLDGEINQNQAIELIKQHTRNYAKRQLTWLRRYSDLNYLNPISDQPIFDQAIKTIKKY